MRRMIFAAAIGLAACNATPGDTLSDTDTADSIIDQLRAGSGKACSADDVKVLVLDMLVPDYEPSGDLLSQDIEIGLNKISNKLELITLASADKDVGSVTCEANVVVSMPGDSDKEFSISYIVRPSVEDEGSFIIRGDFGDAGTYIARATSKAISEAQFNRLQADTASQVEVSSETVDVDEAAADDALNAAGNAVEEAADAVNAM